MSRFYAANASDDVEGVERTARDWELSAIFTDYLERATRRDDIVVRVGRRTSARSGRDPITGEPTYAPGVWWPSESVVELDGTYVPDDIDLIDVDMSKPITMGAVAVITGIAVHEGGHVVHTLWSEDAWAALEPRVRDAVGLLEESRMEGRRVMARPGSARWLRAALKSILLDDLATTDSAAMDGARIAALVLARVDIGLFDSREVQRTRDAVVSLLGEDKLRELEDLWIEAQECEDGDLATLADVARRWCDATGSKGEEDEDDGESDESMPGASSCGAGGDGDGESDGDAEGEGGPSLSDFVAGILADLSGVADSVTEEIEEEAEAAAEAAADQARRDEEEADRVAEMVRSRNAASKAKEASTKLFGHGRGVVGHTPGLIGWREPTYAEQMAAIELASRLQNELDTPPGHDTRASTIPPGKLNSEGMLARYVERTRGLPPTAPQWDRTRTVYAPPLELVIGLAADRSGSMRAAMDSICGASWAVADACSRAGGTFAATLFGEEAEPLCAPGTVPSSVPILDANAGHEAVGSALEALRGALDLDNPRAVRIVVIATDAYWVHSGECAKGIQQIRDLQAAGVTVVIMHSNGDVNTGHGCPVIVFNAKNFAGPLSDFIISKVNRDLVVSSLGA